MINFSDIENFWVTNTAKDNLKLRKWIKFRIRFIVKKEDYFCFLLEKTTKLIQKLGKMQI